MADFYPPLESLPAACPGMHAADCEFDARRAANAMRAGVFASDVGTYKNCKSPAAATDLICGISALLSGRAPAADGTNEYAANDLVSLVTKGQVYVITEAAVSMAIGDPVFSRYTANGGNTLLGALRKDADTARALQLTNAKVVKPTETAMDGTTLVTLIEVNLP